MPSNIKVRKKTLKKSNSTDINLLVSAETDEVYLEWDRDRIVKVLREEGGVGERTAKSIAKSVEDKVLKSGLTKISTSLIRELVDNELFDLGFQKKLEKQTSLGLPKADIEELIFSKSQENSNISANNPEAIMFSIAEVVLKQYALQEVFSEEVSEAHKTGEIHLHDAGHPVRVYCSSHSLEYIKKYGLSLDNLDSTSGPAKHARTLSVQLSSFLASMQAYYAGALGIAYVNLFYAPYVEHMNDEEMYQEAQHLIFQSSQISYVRGNQSVHNDERLILWDNNENKVVYPKIGDFYRSFDIKNDSNRFQTLSMNRDNGKIEWKLVTNAIQHKRLGDMHRVTLSNGCSGVFTDDHSLFTIDDEGEIVEVSAADVDTVITPSKIDTVLMTQLDCSKYLKDYVEVDVDGETYLSYSNKLFNGSDTNGNRFIKESLLGFKIKKNIELNYDFGLLLGEYVGDGCDSGGSGGIAISCFDKDQNKTISDLISRIFGDINCVVEDQGVTIYGKILGNLFENMCGLHANNKRIPDEIMFGPKEVVIGFINGYLSADGCVGNNKIISSTVSDILHDQLYILYKRVGYRSTKRIKAKRAGKKITIKGNECVANYDILENRIGAYDASDIRFINNKREESRINLISNKCRTVSNHDNTHLDQLKYNYNNIKPFIKKVFRNKIALKSNRIDIDVIKYVYEKIKGSINYINNNDIFDISKAGYTLEQLFLYENISKNSGQNTTDRHFYLRDVHRLVDVYNIIINNQIENITKLHDILIKCMNVTPYDAKTERVDNEEYVYDISVQDNENFLLLNGIVAHNSLFVDFNIHTGVPGFLKNVKAIGPGGKYTGRTYDSYEEASQRFARAILKVCKKGDVNGSPFSFPKIDFHINNDTFEDQKQKSLLEYACKVASDNGSIYFIFDRDEVTLSACCRLKTTIDDRYMIDHPESMRYTGFQNVTINLPQCAYRSDRDIDKLYNEIEKVFNVCIKAHLEKKKFVEQLISRPSSPLWQVGKIAKDNRPYIDLEKATYIIGLIGLNECLQYMTNKELHEDEASLWTGIRIVSYMHFLAKEATSKYGLKFTLEESPAESASRRLAKIDIRNFKDAIVRGSIDDDEIYYTNSVHLRPDVDVDLIKRITWQAKFHSLIESGAITHAFVGEKLPSPKSIYNLVHKTFKNTNTAQITISPEFTICGKCHKTKVGLSDKCPNCGSYNIEGIEYGKFDGCKPWRSC